MKFLTGSPPRMRGKQRLRQAMKELQRITPAHAGKTDISEPVRSCMTDHPRACGENNGTETAAANISGSPPRMRGKHTNLVGYIVRERITPAHAGKTFSWLLPSSRHADHPRACGENCSAPLSVIRHLGSPPRMRGKRAHIILHSFFTRITPAHAGKTTA